MSPLSPWLAILLVCASLVCAGNTVPSNTGGLWISTLDEPRQCVQRALTISGGVAPYKLVAVQGDDYATELEVIQDNIPAAGELVWLCNIQQDTSFALKVTDCKGVPHKLYLLPPYSLYL